MLKKIYRKLLTLPEYLAGVGRSKFPEIENLFISHGEYIRAVGGTERVLREQLACRTGAVLFPLFPISLESKLPQFYVMRNCGEVQYSGFLPAVNLASILEHSKNIELHHLMNWKSEKLSILESLLAGRKYLLWVHDLYMFTPQAFNIYTGFTRSSIEIPKIDVEFNLLDPIASSALSRWQEHFLPFLVNAERIKTPSEFMKMAIAKNFAISQDKIDVTPLTSYATRPREQSKKPFLHLAFLGNLLPFKGTQIWQKLLDTPELKKKYKFYQIGGLPSNDEQVTYVPYSTAVSGNEAAIDKLIEYDIDYVLLWSTIPESYSFTMYEAIAAGAFILTYSGSGNIAYNIGRHSGLGKVFPDFEQLKSFLKEI